MVTFSPQTKLSPNQSYIVTIADDFVRDDEGNSFQGFSDETIWNFSTVTTADSEPPQVISLVPSNGSSDVGLTDNLVINFNEPVFVNTAIGISIREAGINDFFENLSDTNGSVTIDGATVTLNPINTFETNTSYYVRVSFMSFEDEAGNDFRGLQSSSDWVFTTLQIPKPRPSPARKPLWFPTISACVRQWSPLRTPLPRITFRPRRTSLMKASAPTDWNSRIHSPWGRLLSLGRLPMKPGIPSESCEQLVTVNDTEAPTAVGQAIIVDLDADGLVIIDPKDLDNTDTPSSDNCTLAENLVYNASRTDFDCADTGAPVTVFFSVTDEAGTESAAVSVEVTVRDVTGPDLTCSGPVVRTSLSGQPLVIEITPPTVVDVCDAIPGQPVASRSDGRPLTDPFEVGETLITWTALDVQRTTRVPASNWLR